MKHRMRFTPCHDPDCESCQVTKMWLLEEIRERRISEPCEATRGEVCIDPECIACDLLRQLGGEE